MTRLHRQSASMAFLARELGVSAGTIFDREQRPRFGSLRLSHLESWSGRPDLNRGPLAPKIGQPHLNACVSNAPSAKLAPKCGGFVPICSQFAPPDREAIRRQVEGFAKRLSRRFPQAFANGHGPSTKEEIIHWIRAVLPPHPGRPRKPSITLACELRRKGHPWREIYPQCIPNLSARTWAERRLEIRRLRNAYRGRHRLARAHPNKNPPSISHAEKN